jgi:hypothetical protein
MEETGMRKAVVVFAIVALAAATFAQEKDPEITRVKDKLKTQSITLAMRTTKLSSVMSFLQDVTQLNVVIDSECDSDTLVTLRANNVKLETALKLILDPIGFDYMVKKGGIVFVSTKKRIAEIRGEKKPKQGYPDLKQGELFLVLRDGSKIKGKVAVDKWKLKTAYGQLEIPTNEIRKITLAKQEKEEGEEKKEKEKKGEEKEAKEKEESPDEDKVETIRFTVTGELQVEKLEIETGKGKLTIPKNDIKEILFSQPVIEKSFEVKPTGEWLDTKILLQEGLTVKIASKGEITIANQQDGSEIIMYPDGAMASVTKRDKEWKAPEWFGKGFPLLARIGKNGKPFEIYKVEGMYSCKMQVQQKGNLYLKVRIPKGAKEAAKKFKGAYKTKVTVQK